MVTPRSGAVYSGRSRVECRTWLGRGRVSGLRSRSMQLRDALAPAGDAADGPRRRPATSSRRGGQTTRRKVPRTAGQPPAVGHLYCWDLVVYCWDLAGGHDHGALVNVIARPSANHKTADSTSLPAVG